MWGLICATVPVLSPSEDPNPSWKAVPLHYAMQRGPEGVGGLSFPGGGGGTALWLGPLLLQKGLNRRPPQNPTETDPQAPEVIRIPNSAKNENWDFWNQYVEGVQKSHHLPCI